MTAIWYIRGWVNRNRATKFVESGAARVGNSSRRFLPRVAELEPRQLLSNIAVVNTADSGPGSLRAAIDSAAPGDLITFAKSSRPDDHAGQPDCD